MGRSLGIAGPDLPSKLPESRARRDDDRRAEEAAAILERAGSSALVVFDERGKSPTTEAFAERVRAWRDEGRGGLTCVIGGPDGLDPKVRQRADWVISFGGLTTPDEIVRALVPSSFTES